MDKKGVLILSVIALVVGAVFFGDQVLSTFRGMSPLEAMKFIVTFILHITAGTIAAYMLYNLPEIFGPFVKLLKGGSSKRQMGRRTEAPKVQKTPRWSTDQMMRMFIDRELTKGSGRKTPPTAPQDDTQLRF